MSTCWGSRTGLGSSKRRLASSERLARFGGGFFRAFFERAVAAMSYDPLASTAASRLLPRIKA